MACQVGYSETGDMALFKVAPLLWHARLVILRLRVACQVDYSETGDMTLFKVAPLLWHARWVILRLRTWHCIRYYLCCGVPGGLL